MLGADQPHETTTQTIMNAKLRHAQSVLKGLAKADFPAIESDTKVLEQLSQMVGWPQIQTREYQRHREEFRHTIRSMAKNARKKNLDGCTLNYVQMTITCVACHKHVLDRE